MSIPNPFAPVLFDAEFSDKHGLEIFPGALVYSHEHVGYAIASEFHEDDGGGGDDGSIFYPRSILLTFVDDGCEERTIAHQDGMYAPVCFDVSVF